MDSKINCRKILKWVAPMAFRTPISWVRSVTVAIIILVILIEPTIIEIIAIIESKTVISLILEEAGWEICSSDAS